MKVFTNVETYKGFTIKAGFVACLDKDGNPYEITSGWRDHNGDLYVYTYNSESQEWTGSWECSMGGGLYYADDVSRLQDEYQDELDTKKALAYLKGKKPYISEDEIVFTDVIAGENSNNGGEYGFYTTYVPLSNKGLYKKYTSCTCDFDTCGTGYEGIVALTQSMYNRLVKKENKVLRDGCLYNN